MTNSIEIVLHALGPMESSEKVVTGENCHIDIDEAASSIRLAIPTKLKAYGLKECSVVVKNPSEFMISQYNQDQVYQSRIAHILTSVVQGEESHCNIVFLYGVGNKDKRRFLFGEQGLVDRFLTDLGKLIPSSDVQLTPLSYLSDTFIDLINIDNPISLEKLDGLSYLGSNISHMYQAQGCKEAFNTIRYSMERIRSSQYDLRTYLLNIIVKKESTISNIWFIELADSHRSEQLSLSPPNMALFETVQRELSAFANILCSISSHRLKIPYQKSRIGTIINNSLITCPRSRIDGFFHLNPTQEHLIAEDACIIQLFNRISGCGIGSARTRDIAADILLLEMQNKKLEAELSVASKIFPALSIIKLKENISYYDQSEKIIAKAVEERNFKDEKERQSIVQEATEYAQEYMKQKIVEWEQQISQLESEEGELENDIQLLPTRRGSDEDEFALQFQNTQKSTQKLRDRIAEVDLNRSTLTSEYETAKNYISQFEERLKEFSSAIEEDRELVEQGRNVIRENWIQTSRTFDEERRQWRHGYSNHTQILRQSYDTLEYDDKDPVYMSLQLSDPFEVMLADIISGKEQVDNSEVIAQFIGDCDVRKGKCENALRSVNRNIITIEAEIEEIVKHTNGCIQSLRKKKEAVAEEKMKDLLQLKHECVGKLYNGTLLTKICEKGKGKKNYYYYILQDKICCCEVSENGVPNKDKLIKSFPMKNISRIVLGPHSENFKAYIQRSKSATDSSNSKGFLGIFSPSTTTKRSALNECKQEKDVKADYYLSFSLILKKHKSLDLIADNPYSLECWIVGLGELLSVGASYGDVLSEPCLTLFNYGQEATQLTDEEYDICSKIHIAPYSLQQLKHVVFQRKNSEIMTALDFKTIGSFNIFQAEALYEFAKVRGWLDNSQSNSIRYI